MAEEAGLENQEPQISKKPTIVKDEPADVPLVGSSKKDFEATGSLDNDSNVAEHIKKTEIESLVKRIGDFFDVPKWAVDQGLKSEGLVLANDEFDRQVENYLRKRLNEEGVGVEKSTIISKDEKDAILSEALGLNIEKENREAEESNKRNAQLIREHAQKTGGAAFPQEDRPKVLIKRDSGLDREMVKTHELIHAMVLRGNVGGFRSADGNYSNTDEAATQVLTLSLLHPEYTVKQMLSSEIKTPYPAIVKKLLVAMFATSQSKKPFTFKDLAKYYFNEEGNIGVYLMQMDIIPRVRKDVREEVKGWLVNDLKTGS